MDTQIENVLVQLNEFLKESIATREERADALALAISRRMRDEQKTDQSGQIQLAQ